MSLCRLARLPRVLTLAVLIAACSSRSAPEAAMEESAAKPASALEPVHAQAALTERQLIRTVTLELVVDDVAKARKESEALVASAGGFVQALDSHRYGGTLHADLTLRVPKDRLDAALAKLRALGAVQHESQAVEDVTRKYVDADARLRNMERTEQRLLSILQSSQGGLSDVLAVERELGRVREESEVLTSELRALKEQISLSTVKLGLSQESDLEPPPSLWSPLQRLWRNIGNILLESMGALIAFGAALATWTLYALPWLPVVAVLWFLAHRLRSWWKRRKASKPRA